jgi:hypothetical protein
MHVVDETGPDKAAIVSAVDAEHADKLGEFQSTFSFILPPLSSSGLCVYAACWWVIPASPAGEEALIRAYYLAKIVR